jgi:hypothetical protein
MEMAKQEPKRKWQATVRVPVLRHFRHRLRRTPSVTGGLVPLNQSINKWYHQHLWSSLEPIWSRATVWRHGDIDLTACFFFWETWRYSESWHLNCALRRQKTKWWCRATVCLVTLWLVYGVVLADIRKRSLSIYIRRSFLLCFFILFPYYFLSYFIDDGLALFKRIIYIYSDNWTWHMQSVGKMLLLFKYIQYNTLNTFPTNSS